MVKGRLMYPSYIDLDGGTSLLSAETNFRLCSNVMGECRHQTCNQIPCSNLPNPQQNVKSLENSDQYFSQLTHSIVSGLKSLTFCDIFLKFMNVNSFRQLGHILDNILPIDKLDSKSPAQPQVLYAFIKPTLVDF